MLKLFVGFPQSTLPEPNDCVFVIRSMMRFGDASFRRERDSIIIRGAKWVYEPSQAQEKESYLARFFGSAVESFLCHWEGNPGKIMKWPNRPEVS